MVTWMPVEAMDLESSVVSLLLLGIVGSVTVGVASAYCMGPDCSAQEDYGAEWGRGPNTELDKTVRPRDGMGGSLVTL